MTSGATVHFVLFR